MSTATAHEPHTHTHSHGGGCCGTQAKAAEPVAAPCPISLTERAAAEVQKAMADYKAGGENPDGGELYLRIRTMGGGCSGMQDKLDLDPNYNPKTDNLYELHGVKVLVDKRSMLYLEGAVVDYHEDLNKRGFSINNPQAKKTCGCGSSYTT
jgi:iron-sulfur cluster assembly accessory protein